MAEELPVTPFALFSLVMVVPFTCETILYYTVISIFQSAPFKFVCLLCLDSFQLIQVCVLRRGRMDNVAIEGESHPNI